MKTLSHQELLKDMGYALGLDLEFDDNGQCFLLLDEELMVSIRNLEDSWVLYGMLGNIWTSDADEESNETSLAKAQVLLALNLAFAEAGGASIALEGSSGVAMLVSRVSTAGVNSERMQEIIGNFVNQLSHAIGILRDESQPQETAPPPSLPAFPPDIFSTRV